MPSFCSVFFRFSSLSLSLAHSLSHSPLLLLLFCYLSWDTCKIASKLTVSWHMCVLVCESECCVCGLLYAYVCVCIYSCSRTIISRSTTFGFFWWASSSSGSSSSRGRGRGSNTWTAKRQQCGSQQDEGRGVAEGRGCYSYRSKIKLVISFSRTASGRNMARLQPKQQYPLCLHLCHRLCCLAGTATDFGLGLHALWASAMAFCFDCGSVRPQCKPPAPPAVSLPLIGFALHLQAAVAAWGIIAFASTMQSIG